MFGIFSKHFNLKQIILVIIAANLSLILYNYIEERNLYLNE
jgi:hypothetical protein